MQNTYKVQEMLLFYDLMAPIKHPEVKKLKSPEESSKVGVLEIPWTGYAGCPYFQQRDNLQKQNELLNLYPVFVKSLELCWKSDSVNCASRDFENLLNM